MTQVLRAEIDGRPVTAEALRAMAFGGYGHFTAMQVRDRCTRGLNLHLHRLGAATAELFGRRLDGDRVREHIRQALGADLDDGSVRVYVIEAAADDEAYDVSVMVTVRPPGEMSGIPQRLKAVGYQRPLAHVKHLGGFAQDYHRRFAQREGFDEALFTGADGVISEGGITNIGFVTADSVVWPDAPALRGITMQLLERGLAERGVPSLHRPVRLSDVASFDGAFVTNARGITAVDRIDDVILPPAEGFVEMLAGVYASVPWDPI